MYMLMTANVVLSSVMRVTSQTVVIMVDRV